MATHDLHKWITSDIDFYTLLGIKIEACTESELRRAYRKTALKYHPDKVGAKFDPEKYEIFQAAYEVLSNPSSKSQYDQFRLAKLQKKRANELFEGKRKQMKEDLEAREKNGISRAEKRPGADEAQPEFQRELKRLAEEGRKKRVERTRMMAENAVSSSKTTSSNENNSSDRHTEESPKYTEKDAEIERLERRIREAEGLKLKRKAEKKARLRSRAGETKSV